MDGSGSGYLRTVCEYVHLNPARVKLLRPEQPLRAYRWSSWPEYLRSPGRRPAWLRVGRVLGETGIYKDSAAGRRELERVMEARRGAEVDEAYRPIRRGWFFGEPVLRKALLGQMSERLGAEHYGEERQESQAEKAERVVAEELQLEEADADRLRLALAELDGSAADLEAHRRFDELQRHWAPVLAASHLSQAPWYLIPSDHRWQRDLLLASLLARVLEPLALDWPQRPAPFRAEDLL